MPVLPRLQSPARPRAPAALVRSVLLLSALAATACERHKYEPYAAHVTQSEDAGDAAPRLQPGPMRAEPEAYHPRELPVGNPYQGDARAIQEGRRLYRWMNCNGCHAEGGGSIGPTLWDDQWRYGGRGIDIAESILYGRPNGMPAFAGHLPEDQVWKIVSYVQTLEPRGGPYRAGVR